MPTKRGAGGTTAADDEVIKEEVEKDEEPDGISTAADDEDDACDDEDDCDVAAGGGNCLVEKNRVSCSDAFSSHGVTLYTSFPDKLYLTRIANSSSSTPSHTSTSTSYCLISTPSICCLVLMISTIARLLARGE